MDRFPSPRGLGRVVVWATTHLFPISSGNTGSGVGSGGGGGGLRVGGGVGGRD